MCSKLEQLKSSLTLFLKSADDYIKQERGRGGTEEWRMNLNIKKLNIEDVQ